MVRDSPRLPVGSIHFGQPIVPTRCAPPARSAFERGLLADLHEVVQILGRALGYPRFADFPDAFPGATDADGVCVGEHVAATLAAEAADQIAKLRRDIEGALTGGRIAVDAKTKIERELERLRLGLELLAEDPPPTHAELLAALQRLAAA